LVGVRTLGRRLVDLLPEGRVRAKELTCLADNTLELLRVVAVEERVKELPVLLVLDGDLLEVVHIQLPVERLKVLVMEEPGQ